MRRFLPALLLCEHWSFTATVQWGPERSPRTFALDHEEGLVSHYRNRGVYITEEQRSFEAGFKKLKSGWRTTRRTPITNLGGRDVLVPDLVFTHEDGRKAMLEIVGYWRRGWLEAKLGVIGEHGPSNLLLAVSDRMCGDLKAELDELPATVIPFKGVLLPKKVLAAVEEVALR
mgnify:CR=1 FL=1